MVDLLLEDRLRLVLLELAGDHVLGVTHRVGATTSLEGGEIVLDVLGLRTRVSPVELAISRLLHFGRRLVGKTVLAKVLGDVCIPQLLGELLLGVVVREVVGLVGTSHDGVGDASRFVEVAGRV